MHDCWKAVITWLTSIDVIIRMYSFSSNFASHDLYGSVRYHLISIHIWLRSWSSLPNH